MPNRAPKKRTENSKHISTIAKPITSREESEYFEARNGIPAGDHVNASVIEKVLAQRELFEVGKKANAGIQDRQAIGS